jgi:hypothetical protein
LQIDEGQHAKNNSKNHCSGGIAGVSQLKFQLPGKGLLQKSFGFLNIAPPALCYYI